MLTKLSLHCKVGNMETKKAVLSTRHAKYYVNYIGPRLEGLCAVTLDWEDPAMGDNHYNRKRMFVRFIEDIGFPSYKWDYYTDKHEEFLVSSYGLTMVEPEAAHPVRDPKHDHWKLTGVASRKLEEFSEEGYLIVRVEDTMDMNEGTITLHYKKEEAK